MERILERQTGAVATDALVAAPARPGTAPASTLQLGLVSTGTISSDLIEQLRVLEEMKSAITALQARVAVAFDLVQRAEQAEAGVPVSERGRAWGLRWRWPGGNPRTAGPGCLVWRRPL